MSNEQPNVPNEKKKSNRNRYLAAHGALAALMLVLIVPGSANILGSLSPTNSTTTDHFEPHGYVVVSARHPDGTEFYHNEQHNIITNAGKDFISAQTGSTTPGGNGANYIALTNTAITPSAAHTTLSGEIAVNGLSRAQGAYAHTNGQNTYTITNTFTATGAQSAQAAGLFTASSSGTMLAENTFTSVSLQTNDQLTVTWTITLS